MVSPMIGRPSLYPLAPKETRADELRRKLGELAKRPKEPRPVGEWPDAVDATTKLIAEANALAARLGHARMSEWMPRDGYWRSRCHDCSAPATISPREFGAAPIRGEAVTFRCRR